MFILKLTLVWVLVSLVLVRPWLLMQRKPLRGSREDQFANWQRSAYSK